MSPVGDVLWECFRHFAHLDESNAAVHYAPVRYSSLTFRLAEHLDELNDRRYMTVDGRILAEVLRHRGRYMEDKGR